MRSIAEIATSQTPLALAPGATVQEACKQMRKRKVGAVLVADAERNLLGIVTGRDVVGRVIAEGKDPATTRLQDVMTTQPRVLGPERPAIDALRMMFHLGCRHVPIVDRGKLVGIVSRADFRGIELAQLDEETDLWERI